MNNRRILLLGSYLLFFTCLLYNIYFNEFMKEECQTVIIYNLDMALNMAVKGDLVTASTFAREFGQETKTLDFFSRVSRDLSLSGIICLAPLWIIPKLEYTSETTKNILAILLVLFGILPAVGDWLQALAVSVTGRYLTFCGYIGLAAGLICYLFFAAVTLWLHPPARKKKRKSFVKPD
jgi:hypothetical protein